jgi:hypothetical protein
LDVSWIERKMYRAAVTAVTYSSFLLIIAFFLLCSLSLSDTYTHAHAYTKRTSAFLVVTAVTATITTTVNFSIISLPLE